MFLDIYRLNLRRFMRYFKTRRAAKLITIGLFLAVFLAVAIGIYQFFSHSFFYIAKYPDLRNAVMLYSLELFLLLVTFLIWLSSLISLLFGLFKNKQQQLVASSPRYGLMPWSALLTTFLSNLWILVFVILPGFLAIAQTFGFSLSGIILGLAACVLLVAVVVLAAFCTVLALGFLIYTVRQQRSNFKLLAALVGIVIIGSVAALGARFSRHDIFGLLLVDTPIGTALPTGPIFNAFHNYPSNLPAIIIADIEQGNQITAALKTLQLTGWTLGFLALGFWLSQNFLYLWQKMSEGNGRLADTRGGIKRRTMHFGRWLTSGFRAVIYKETLLLFRNSRNAFWLLFLLVIWLCYIGININFQARLKMYAINLPQLPLAVLALQLLILVYFIAALVLRFAFPSFSSEKNTAWIVASSPVSLGRLLWAKFNFFSVVFGEFALAAGLINTLTFYLPAGHTAMFLLLGVSGAIFVTALGLFFGAKYPNFETTDPESLSTSVPGLVFVFLSIIYGSLAAGSYFTLLSGQTWISLIFIAASLAGCYLLMKNAARGVDHVEMVVNRE